MNAYKNVSFVGFVIFFFGIVLAVYGFSFLSELNDLEENAVRVKGTVTELNEKAIYRSPFVKFTTEDGQEIQFLSKFEYNVDFAMYEVGQTVDVIYDKNDPNNARIDAFWEKHFPQMFLGIFGAFLMLLGWFLRRHFLKKAAQYS